MTLGNGKLCEGASAELVGIRPATVSRHLSVLLNTCLVDCEKHGRCLCCRQAVSPKNRLVRETLSRVRANLRGVPQMTKGKSRVARWRRAFPSRSLVGSRINSTARYGDSDM